MFTIIGYKLLIFPELSPKVYSQTTPHISSMSGSRKDVRAWLTGVQE